MSVARQTFRTVHNERVQLTEAERATIDALNASVAEARPPEDYDAVTESRKSLAKETREALRSAIPDLEERGRGQIEWIRPELDKLKGTAWPVRGVKSLGSHGPIPWVNVLAQPPNLADIGAQPPNAPWQPPNVGELWWAETNSFVTAPADTLILDIDDRPYRIWGHIRHTSDNLMNGTAGFVMTFILGPERMPRTGRTTFEVRPELRQGGWVSGWTGLYHWIWHADDKWSKCWRHLQATITLSSGEQLAGKSLHQDLFLLDDVYPIGQASINEFFGWTPVLTFAANMADLRQHGVSIILRTELRYDFQLEGESDIWFRHRPGSATDSVPGFDNALTYRCWPGSIPV